MKKSTKKENHLSCEALCEMFLQKPCFVIDFLPRQVPAEGGGQFFAVERYFLLPTRRGEFFRKIAQIVLGAACYYDLILGDGEHWLENPSPQDLYERITQIAPNESLTVLFPKQETLLILNGCDLYLTVYSDCEELLETVRPLASAQGLFVREGV